MIAQRKKTFIISQNPIVAVSVPNNEQKAQEIQIQYFTDSVYHSLVYPVPFTLQFTQQTSETSQTKSLAHIKMNFEFLLTQTKVHKKIFDNIGVIKIKSPKETVRYGILVTEQKGKIWVSLIE